MLLSNGQTNLRDLLRGVSSGKPITKIVVGTSDTPVSSNDTVITNAVAVNVTTVDILPGGVIKFNATLAAGDPAMTIQEVGLLNSDGVLVHRKVITPKLKVAGVTYAIYFKITIQ